MEGSPEGASTTPTRGGLSPLWLVLSVVFAFYLLFRVAEGVAWLVHHV